MKQRLAKKVSRQKIQKPQAPPASAAPVWPLLILAAIAFTVNIGALYNGFLLDDETQVLRNPWIRDWRLIPQMFTGDVWSFAGPASGPTSNYYRPLMHVSYLLTNKIFGLEPWAFHLVNVGFHVACTLLVFAVASRLARKEQMPANSSWWDGFLSVPFISAALFAVHPVHSEAIAWIASVPELTFTAFFLASLALWAGPLPISKGRAAAALAAYGLALLCKETAIVLPLLLLLYDLSFRPGEQKSALGKRYIPFLLITVAYLTIRYMVMGRSPITTLPSSAGPLSFTLYLLHIFSEYLRITLAPTGLHFWHAMTPLDSIALPRAILSVTVAGFFLAAVVLAWKLHRPAFFCLALFLLPLLPAFNVTAIAGKSFAERYLYLPSAGIAILAAMFLGSLLRRKDTRVLATGALALVISLFSAGTILRNQVWKDLLTLYSDNITKSPAAPAPCNDLARALFEQGKTDEAIRLFQQIVQSGVSNPTCQSALGSALLVKGRIPEAVTQLKAALSLDPSDLDTLNDLGLALRRSGRNEEAIEQYRKALQLNPNYADAHFNMAAALMQTGAFVEALEHYRTAVRLRPTDAYYHNVLGIECAKHGLLGEAIKEFEQAVNLVPAEAAYRQNLDRARALSNRNEDG